MRLLTRWAENAPERKSWARWGREGKGAAVVKVEEMDQVVCSGPGVRGFGYRVRDRDCRGFFFLSFSEFPSIDKKPSHNNNKKFPNLFFSVGIPSIPRNSQCTDPVAKKKPIQPNHLKKKIIFQFSFPSQPLSRAKLSETPKQSQSAITQTSWSHRKQKPDIQLESNLAITKWLER